MAQIPLSASPQRPPHAVARATVGLTALTVLSMATGLAVEMLLAWAFGASPVVDAYRVDYLLISLGTSLFVLQVLPNVTVPIFTEYRERGETEDAWRATMSFGNLMSLAAVAAGALCFIWPEGVVAILAPGLHGEGRATALLFARWFAVAVALMAWSGAAVGILYANDVFWPPMTASAAGNVILGASTAIWGGRSGAVSIVIGVMLGAAVTLGLIAAALVRLVRSRPQARLRLLFTADFRHPGVKKEFRLAMPMVGTVALGFWGTAVMYRALCSLPPGAISIYGYAWKLVQLSTLLPGALLTVIYPRLAASWCDSQAAFKTACTRGLRMALFVSIILCCLGFAFRVPIIAILLEHGALSREASALTARAFALLVLGAPGYVAFIYIQRMFHAAQNSTSPLLVQLPCVVALTVLAPIAVSRYGLDGACGLNSLYALAAAVAILLAFSARYRAIGLVELSRFALRILPIAAVATWLGAEVGRSAGGLTSFCETSHFIAIAAGGIVAVALFYAATSLLRMREALLGREFVRSQGSAVWRRHQRA